MSKNKFNIIISAVIAVFVLSLIFGLFSSLNREIDELRDRQDKISDEIKETSSTSDTSSTTENPPVVTVKKNLVNPAEIEMNYAIAIVDGTQYELEGKKCTGFIEIEANTAYVYSDTSASYAGVMWAFYDADKNFINGQSGGQSITTPENAKYVRFSVTGSRVNMQLEKGTTATEFEEYIDS